MIDFPTIIKAFSIASKADLSIKFGIFSDVSQLNMWNFNDMFDVYGIKDKCLIMEPQPEINFGFRTMGEVYASSDLFILPHQEDILNIPAIEAEYCGKRVITSPFGPSREYLSDKAVYLDKSDVFIAPPLNTRYRIFDAEEIADKIVFSFLQHDKMKNKEDKKLRQYLNKYSWDKTVIKWNELF